MPNLGEIIGGSQREENYDVLLQRMRDKFRYSQLLDLLRVLGINTKDATKLDEMRAERKRMKSAIQDLRHKLNQAESLHTQASGFHSGKGKALKLLKASKPKKTRKRRAKKNVPKEPEPEPERPGPFRLF